MSVRVGRKSSLAVENEEDLRSLKIVFHELVRERVNERNASAFQQRTMRFHNKQTIVTIASVPRSTVDGLVGQTFWYW